ncbi:MAG: hypothetical protein DMD79_25215, partial [Candidatus Rokuibacteriota bacterium]
MTGGLVSLRARDRGSNQAIRSRSLTTSPKTATTGGSRRSAFLTMSARVPVTVSCRAVVPQRMSA